MTLSGLLKLLATVTVLFLVKLGSETCFGAEAPGSSTLAPVKVPTISSSAPAPIKVRPVIGMNTNFFEPQGVFDNGGVWNAVEAAKMPMMRFPGGTRSNYYDWRTGRIRDTGGVEPGLEKGDAVPMDEFMSRARRAGIQVSYVVNITDPPESIQALARRWKETGAPVRWVELGNEHYLPDYIQRIGGPAGYLDKARRALAALRAGGYAGPAGLVVAPEIDVGQVDGPDQESRAWNRVLAKADTSGFDAVVVHVYPSLKRVGFQDAYSRSPSALTAEVGNLRRMFPRKQVWLTEWNLGKPTIPQVNTLWNALFNLRMTKAILDNRVELSAYHVLTGHGWELLHVSDRAGQDSAALEREVPYFAFQMVNEARSNGAAYVANPKLRITLPAGTERMIFRTRDQLRIVAWTSTGNAGSVRVETDTGPLKFAGGKELRGDLNATNESKIPEEEIKATPLQSPLLRGPGVVMLKFSLGAARGSNQGEN